LKSYFSISLLLIKSISFEILDILLPLYPVLNIISILYLNVKNIENHSRNRFWKRLIKKLRLSISIIITSTSNKLNRMMYLFAIILIIFEMYLTFRIIIFIYLLNQKNKLIKLISKMNSIIIPKINSKIYLKNKFKK
jgi:hypothetical protein